MRLSFRIFTDLYKMDFVAAEVGVYKGDNALAMLGATNNIKQLVLVDSFKPYYKWFTNNISQTFHPEEARIFVEMVKERFKSYDNVLLLHKDSTDASKDFPDEYFDYVYIDGGHDYENVKNDLEVWYPKVKKGGVLGGHDSMYPGVTRAIIEFAMNRKINIWAVSRIQYDLVPSQMGEFEDWWLVK